MRSTGIFAITIAAVSVPSPAAASATASATMQVGAVVEPSCNLDVAPLTFEGAKTAAPGAEAQATIAVSCTPETSFAISLDGGEHSANGRRRMASASSNDFLEYEIYQDAGRTRRWNGSATGVVSGVVPASGQVELTAYGQITAATAAPARYADTVTVLVMF